MNRPVLDERFRVKARSTWNQEISAIQPDLDRFLANYNLERSHQDYRLKGRTSAQALREALCIEELPSQTYQPDSTEDAIDQPQAAWLTFPKDGCRGITQLVHSSLNRRRFAPTVDSFPPYSEA